MSFQHLLLAGLNAMPVSADGIPFDRSNIYASGNVAADVSFSVTAESTGRMLVVRLHHMTDDPGMKDMLKLLIARDDMHQQQWLAVIEELGGYENVLPIPNRFPHDEHIQEFQHVYVDTRIGRGEFNTIAAAPVGDKPKLNPPSPDTFPQNALIKR